MTGILQKRYVNPYYYWVDEFTPYQNHVKSVTSSDGLKGFDQSERWVIWRIENNPIDPHKWRTHDMAEICKGDSATLVIPHVSTKCNLVWFADEWSRPDGWKTLFNSYAWNTRGIWNIKHRFQELL